MSSSCIIQSNLVSMNSKGTIKNVHIDRNLTLIVTTCISVIMPGDFNAVCI